VDETGSDGFLENPRLWRFSSGSQQAGNMIKVPENFGMVFVQKLTQKNFVVAFQRLPKASKEGREHKVDQAGTKLVPVDFLRIQGFGDLVQCPGKPQI